MSTNSHKTRINTETSILNLVNHMGFASYQEYVDSELFHKIAKTAMEDYCGRCRLCAKPAKVVRPMRYGKQILMGYAPHLMYTLCYRCNHHILFSSGEYPRTVEDQQYTFRRMIGAVNLAIKDMTQQERTKCVGYCNTCGSSAMKRSLQCRKCAGLPKRRAKKSKHAQA